MGLRYRYVEFGRAFLNAVGPAFGQWIDK